MQLSDRQNEQFTADGFVRIENVLPPEILKGASDALYNIFGDDPAKNGIIQYFDEPGLFELLQHPALERIAQQILGTDDVILNSSAILFRRPDGTTLQALDAEHVDIQYSLEELDARPRQQLCMLMIIVDDLPNGRGNTFVRPGSHRQIAQWLKNNGQEPMKAHPLYYDRLPELPYADPIPVTGNAGDVVAFCTCIIHCGSKNIDTKPRKILFVNFCEMGKMKALSGNHNLIAKRTEWRDLLRANFRPERKHLMRDSELPQPVA